VRHRRLSYYASPIMGAYLVAPARTRSGRRARQSADAAISPCW
jgi:hypothetical protein